MKPLCRTNQEFIKSSKLKIIIFTDIQISSNFTHVIRSFVSKIIIYININAKNFFNTDSHAVFKP